MLVGPAHAINEQFSKKSVFFILLLGKENNSGKVIYRLHTHFLFFLLKQQVYKMVYMYKSLLSHNSVFTHVLIKI